VRAGNVVLTRQSLTFRCFPFLMSTHNEAQRSTRMKDPELDNLSINNLENNFYSSDLDEAIRARKNTQNRRLISRAAISLGMRNTHLFSFSIKM